MLKYTYKIKHRRKIMFNDIESILIGVVLIGIFIPIMCVLAKKSSYNFV